LSGKPHAEACRSHALAYAALPCADENCFAHAKSSFFWGQKFIPNFKSAFSGSIFDPAFNNGKDDSKPAIP
jgi:hypothetical protein